MWELFSRFMNCGKWGVSMVFGWQKGKYGDQRKLDHILKNIPTTALVFFYMYLCTFPNINLSAFFTFF